MAETLKTAQHWRAQLKAAQEALKVDFYAHSNARRCLQQRTSFIDKLLRAVWKDTNIFNDTCLIAVGGYGRGELFPHSDIDVLILPPESPPPQLNVKIEALVTLLWDIGLNVGHSVRTLSECVEEAARDATVMTNLLESRLLAGDHDRYLHYLQRIRNCIQPQAFLQAKIREQDQRHAKFNDTEYNLEPNIKESPGGLRDLHMILWLSQSQDLGATWVDLYPVSYTHLDVYKRQPMISASANFTPGLAFRSSSSTRTPAASRPSANLVAASRISSPLPVASTCTSKGATARGQARPRSSQVASATAATARETPTP